MVRPYADASDGAQERPKVTPAIVAEASVWVARLHGPDRSPEMERGLREWQAMSPAHREAFEKCTDAWLDAGKLNFSTAYNTVVSQKSRRAWGGRRAGSGWLAGGAIAGLVAISIYAGHRWQEPGAFDTDIGEQRVVTLDDGSRMRLNTDTQVRVSFDDHQRTVTVRRGEALFEVSKDALRPFVVRASGSEVVAVGTAFAVRYGSGDAGAAKELAVTLIEGQVNVRPAADVAAGAIAPPQVVAMKAGERLRLGGQGGTAAVVPKVDRPNVEEVTAWKRSEAVFDNTALAEAVAEMNRYNRTPIVLVDDLARSNLRVSGLYPTGDSVGFANAVAQLYGLRLRNEPGRLALEKAE